jgi:hypothetical protein
MQELRLLLISLATVLLSSILLFIYFKTRISKVEEKLEIMFNLIQSHAQEKQLSAEQFVPYENNSQNSMGNNVESNRVNLIDVSDNDDDETDSDDSETDSDNEESELVIDNDSLIDSEDNIKKIELNVDNKDVLFDNYLNQENLNNLEEHDTEIIVQKEEGVESDKQFEAGETEEEVEEVEEVEEQIDLTKLRVVELRKLCSETGKTGYKSLKKQELINLLLN